MTYNALLSSLEKNYAELDDGPLVCMWSGGCDSTLVLNNLLWTLKNAGDKRMVTTFSFGHYQIGEDKMDAELTARLSYAFYAKQNGLPLGLNKVVHIDRHAIISGGGCCQPALWISHIMPYIADNSILFLGYHQGDCFWTYDIFQAWAQVFTGLSELYKKKIECRAPLYWASKVDIIKELKKNKIYDYTWYCEGAHNNGKPCGHCDPCQTHMMASLYLDRDKIQLMTDGPRTTPISDDECERLETSLVRELSLENIGDRYVF